MSKKTCPSLEPKRKLVASLAPDIALAVQQGESRLSQEKKYNISGYWVCAALYVMGMPIPKKHLKDIRSTMSKYRNAQGAKRRYKRRYEANKPFTPPVNQMRKEVDKMASDPFGGTLTRRMLPYDANEALKHDLSRETTLVYRQDQKIKSLQADIEQWVKEVERLTPFEKKYTELMAAYNEKIAAEVAAEETLAHKG